MFVVYGERDFLSGLTNQQGWQALTGPFKLGQASRYDSHHVEGEITATKFYFCCLNLGLTHLVRDMWIFSLLFGEQDGFSRCPVQSARRVAEEPAGIDYPPILLSSKRKVVGDIMSF